MASDQPQNIVIVMPEPVRWNPNPIGFFTWAEQFRDAGDLVRERTERLSPVPYYLYCHAMELVLKSYLLAEGFTLDQVKRLKHDLKDILRAAERHGLATHVQIPPHWRQELLKANRYYRGRDSGEGKGFEYFHARSALLSWHKSLPSLDVLRELCDALLAALRTVCMTT